MHNAVLTSELSKILGTMFIASNKLIPMQVYVDIVNLLFVNAQDHYVVDPYCSVNMFSSDALLKSTFR